jgi:hypothetical protein
MLVITCRGLMRLRHTRPGQGSRQHPITTGRFTPVGNGNGVTIAGGTLRQVTH